MMESLPEVQKILSECQQSHLLKYWDELKEDQQKDFIRQLTSINFKEVCELHEKAQKNVSEENKKDTDSEDDKKDTDEVKMKPIHPESEKNVDPVLLEEYRMLGLEAIANSRVAVVVLAGGQGTRLGLPFPKGMCTTGIPSEKTLFQLQAERIRRLMNFAKDETGKSGTIYWYIMTSESTNNLTDKFLKENRYFGLNKDDVKLFKQGLFPCFDFSGKIMLEEKDSVALAPDGNGGIYRALASNGILVDMEEKGVKHVYIHSVDNILVKVADPVFIGKCVKSEADCGVKVVRKTDPKEPLGVVCKVNDHYEVVEYSEISEEQANLRNEKGDLVYSAGNICSHLFTTDFLNEVATEHETNLKLHTAEKVVTYIGGDGDKIRPNAVNGIKIEKFIFDVLCFSKKLVAWEVERSEEFSPVKNNDVSGVDCFPTARKDLLLLHKTYIEKAGGTVKSEQVEISPLLSYAGENLERVRGKVFDIPSIIYSDEEEEKRRK